MTMTENNNKDDRTTTRMTRVRMENDDKVDEDDLH